MQVAGPGAKLEQAERELRDPGPARCSSGCRPAGSATPTPSPSRAAYRVSSTRGSPGTRSPAGSRPSARPWSPGGGPARRGRLVRRQLRPLRPVPARRHDQLRQRPGARHRLRRRLRRPRRGAAERAGLDPRRPVRGGRRAAALRGHHHLQRAARERRPCGRPGRRPRHRRPRPPRGAVRPPDGVRDRGDRPRHGQGGAGAVARRPPLHRLHRHRRGRRPAGPRRRHDDPGHGDRTRRDERRRRRPAAPRADGRRRRVHRPHADPAVRADPRQHRRGRTRLGHVQGLGGHPALQRAAGRSGR